jgi:very-short-patch-repair endonuclease
MAEGPSPASLRSAPSPAGGRREAGIEPLVSSPLPPAGEGGAQRRVRAVGKRYDAAVRARALRRSSTEAATLLWSHLRNRHLDGWRFSRQYPIGPCFADFVCREAALGVEVGGGDHSDSKSDQVRDRFINSAGYSVLRFWNNAVTEGLEGVLTILRQVLEGWPSRGWRFAPANLSPAGQG